VIPVFCSVGEDAVHSVPIADGPAVRQRRLRLMSTENDTSLPASVRHAAPVAVQKGGKWLVGREKNLCQTTAILSY